MREDVDIMEAVELKLRRLADDLTVLRAALIAALNSLPPPDGEHQRAAA